MVSMSIEVDVDTKELQRALQQYSRATGKEEADIVNKACLNMLIGKLPGKGQKPYGVFQNTPKTTAAAIEADLWADYTSKKTGKDSPRVYQLAARNLKGTSPKKTKSGKVSKSKSNKWQNRIAAEAKRFVARRKKSVGYFQAGWIQLIKTFGGKKNVAKKDQRTKLGFYEKATTSKLVAFIANNAKGIDDNPKAVSALRRAVSGTARDMGDYAAKKLQKVANKFKGR